MNDAVTVHVAQRLGDGLHHVPRLPLAAYATRRGRIHNSNTAETMCVKAYTDKFAMGISTTRRPSACCRSQPRAASPVVAAGDDPVKELAACDETCRVDESTQGQSCNLHERRCAKEGRLNTARKLACHQLGNDEIAMGIFVEGIQAHDVRVAAAKNGQCLQRFKGEGGEAITRMVTLSMEAQPTL